MFSVVISSSQLHQVYIWNWRFRYHLSPHQGSDMDILFKTLVLYVHHPWWGPRWQSKRRFYICTWRGWLPERTTMNSVTVKFSGHRWIYCFLCCISSFPRLTLCLFTNHSLVYICQTLHWRNCLLLHVIMHLYSAVSPLSLHHSAQFCTH